MDDSVGLFLYRKKISFFIADIELILVGKFYLTLAGKKTITLEENF